jgi:carbamoyl-phosphate synthase large subunit
MERVSKVLLIGSGGIKIAEAAEFDYSGSQALKALKDEGIATVLVNPNIATIQTSKLFADKVYFTPISTEFLEKIIERERPDGIMVGFGGQTALTSGVQLYRSGTLDKYGVKVLGTPISGIEAALTRSLFRDTMVKAALPVPPSQPATTLKEAVEAAKRIGFPVIIRISFNLGGRGSFVASGESELWGKLTRAFSHSAVGSVLVEKYLEGWKEIEYEVMRDRAGNCVAVACLENIEPMGVHTGDSLVVAPSQTLTDIEYQTLREASFGVANAIQLVGECNVQLALNQSNGGYYVIETNPRMSRSSALASKATGYPLAYIAAKLCLGYLLDELLNLVTGTTTAFFEPSLDYIVLKAPRWDLEKFWPRSETLGSEMMSVGEVMAVGRSLEEVYQKAFRMLDLGYLGLVDREILETRESLEEVLKRLKTFKPYWLRDVAKALWLGASVEEISRITRVDQFFIAPVKKIVDLARIMRGIHGLDNELREKLVAEALKCGFTYEQISLFSGLPVAELRAISRRLGVTYKVKNIDTLAGEKPARTNYLYLTCHGVEDDISLKEKDLILLLGAGGFRIGVSVEFDWSAVNIYRKLTELGRDAAIINYNPETVSTDWDVVSYLINQELTPEAIEEIFRMTRGAGVITSAAGQIGNNVAEELEARGVTIIGTQSSSISRAEERNRFSKLLEELGIKQPAWGWVRNVEEALKVVERIGYPVIVRPSYILSGTSVFVARDRDELKELMEKLAGLTAKPIVMSHFFQGAIEAEVDCVSDSRRCKILPMDHVEYAGVHSGDATIVIPPLRLSDSALKRIAEYTGEIARALRVKGPFNVQYLVRDGEVYVIECNLRCSRSMPFSSKIYGYDLAEDSVRAMLNMGLHDPDHKWIELYPEVYAPLRTVWGVKTPQFSWAQIRDCYPFLGPEMRSTGEVAALGLSFHEALLTSWLAATPNRLPAKEDPILIYGESSKYGELLLEAARNFSEASYEVLTLQDQPLPNLPQLDRESAVKSIKSRRIGMVVTAGYTPQLDYEVRRAAVDHNLPIVLNAELALELSKAIRSLYSAELVLSVLEISEYQQIDEEKVATVIGRERTRSDVGFK